MYRHGKNRSDRIEELNTCIYSNSRRETRARGAGSDLEGGQNRRELARIARPRRVLESRSQRASGTLFRPKCAHKTRNSIAVLYEMANHAVAADARRNSADDRHTPLPPRCSIVQAWPPSPLTLLASAKVPTDCTRKVPNQIFYCFPTREPP